MSPTSELEKKAEQKAKELRGRWEMGHEPVDLFLLLQEHGYDLVRWRMESDVSGCLAHVPEIGPVIFVNTKDRTLGHQVFSAAHELFHLLNGNGEPIRWEHINNEGEEKSVEEKAADRFAVEFLLPGPGLNAVMEEIDVIGRDLEPKHVVRMQMRFGVFYQCMVYRLNNLGFITAHKRGKLLEGTRPVKLALELGYDSREIFGEEGPIYPKRFRSYAVKALAENKISVRKFMNLMDLDQEQFRQYTDELGISDELKVDDDLLLEEI